MATFIFFYLLFLTNALQVDFDIAASYDPCTQYWHMSADAPTIQIYNFQITDAHVAFDRIYHNATLPATTSYGNFAMSGSLSYDALDADISFVPPSLNASVKYSSSAFAIALDLQYDGTYDCDTNPGKSSKFPMSYTLSDVYLSYSIVIP